MYPNTIVALLTIAKAWKQPKCPSIDNWLKKMLYIYIYVYICTHVYTHTHTHIYITHIHTLDGVLLSHKKDEVLHFAAMWKDIEDIF